MQLVAAVEGGGTTFEVALCSANSGKILHRTSIDSTGDPATTLTRCALFLQKHSTIAALGVATFGPVGIKPSDPDTYGRILHTSPKKAWRGIDVLTPLKEACGGGMIPVLMDTDVNAPAFSEYAEDGTVSSCAYITVGTGVGVGLVVNHATVQGLMHPEGGHIAVPPLPEDSFGGYSWGNNGPCPYNAINTVESLASSVALMERYQQLMDDNNIMDRNRLKDVPDDSEIWEHAANALASLCTTLLLTLSIERIVLGGGVMRRPQLLGMIQKRTAVLLNGYLPLDDAPKSSTSSSSPQDNEEALKRIIRLSRHGDDAGLVGAIQLARRALNLGTVDKETVVKREAFQAGIVHGILVGIVGTALVVKFGFQNNSRR